MKNEYEIRGDVTAIFFNRRNGQTYESLIDTKDLTLAQSYPNTWYLRHDPGTNSYYIFGAKMKNKVSKTFYLHRLIVDAPESLQVDHINHNTLDNRRCNLRLVTIAQNQQNRIGPASNNKSGVRGVCWVRREQKWKAAIRINGKDIYLGKFTDINKANEVVKQARAALMPFSKDARN